MDTFFGSVHAAGFGWIWQVLQVAIPIAIVAFIAYSAVTLKKKWAEDNAAAEEEKASGAVLEDGEAWEPLDFVLGRIVWRIVVVFLLCVLMIAVCNGVQYEAAFGLA